MPRASMGEAAQDYLKLIYYLQTEAGGASTTAIARALEVAAPSATAMVKRLAARKLVRHSPYRSIELTSSGRQAALEVLRHHRLLELFLRRMLGFALAQVHGEADRLEHVISEELEAAIAAALGDPTTDPHGAPIPDLDGRVATRDLVPLTELAEGASGTIQMVTAREPERLAYLERLGLLPGVSVTVTAKKPFQGPLVVRLTGRKSEMIGAELARELRVSTGATGVHP